MNRFFAFLLPLYLITAGMILVPGCSARRPLSDIARREPAAALSASVSLSMELTLPGGRLQKFELNERHDSKRRWLYSNQVLDGIEGEGWIEKTSSLIDQARPVYERALGLGLLPDCAPSANKNVETVILLESGETSVLAGSKERRAYMNSSNPGPIIESRMWQEQGIERLILHEMVHFWCNSRADKQNERGRWLEEGVADWVAFEIQGSAPQQTVSDYFAQPCKKTLYGSSFLWVLARAIAAATPPAEPPRELNHVLAQLHLDQKRELGRQTGAIHGQISAQSTPACPTPPVGYGRVSGTCPAGSPSCVPIWQTPWGPQLTPAQGLNPTSFFIWSDTF